METSHTNDILAPEQDLLPSSLLVPFMLIKIGKMLKH